MDNNEQFAHSTPTSFLPNAHSANNKTVAAGTGNNLNINLPDNNAVLRLEVELRDKNVRHRPHQRRAKGYHQDRIRAVTGMTASAATVGADGKYHAVTNANNYFVPMEKVSDFLVCNCMDCCWCFWFALNFFFLHSIRPHFFVRSKRNGDFQLILCIQFELFLAFVRTAQLFLRCHSS